MAMPAAIGSRFLPRRIGGSISWGTTNRSNITLNGSNVSQIDDLSEAGDDFPQGTASSQPPLVQDSINNFPAMVPDGVADYFNNAISTYSSNKLTVFYVAERISFLESTTVIDLVNTALPNDYDTAQAALIGYTLTSNDIRGFRNNVDLSQVAAPSNGVPFSFAMKFDGTNSIAYINGVAGTPVASSGNFGFNTILIFTRWVSSIIQVFNNIKLGEWVIFDDALSDTQIADMTNYLTTSWGI